MAAITERHGVARVQPKSVSPGVYALAQPGEDLAGVASVAAESVTRRCASTPSGAPAGFIGGSSGHQVTTGDVGHQQRCHDRVRVLAERAIHPQHDGLARRRLAHPDLGVEPGLGLGLRVITARIRDGCSRAAWLAARMASYCAASSVTMMSVSTMPMVIPPSWCRASVSALG